MNFATKANHRRIIVWMIWLTVLVAGLQPAQQQRYEPDRAVALLGVVTHDPKVGPLFPWQGRYRWKKWALAKYRVWRRASRRAKRAALLARLALSGVMRMAQVVDWLTAHQVRYQLGALPVLYALLETLKVRQIINGHCRSQAEVDHGTVALVLVLNRLMFPLPLYQVADWVGQTVLGAVLGVPALKFNDDRLGRTLDALYPHLQSIWLEVVETAMLKADIDLSVIFYDLTAFVAQGRYAESKVIDFGFAHNTPRNKRKFKTGLNVTADGHLPWLYQMWSGRTADQATVQSNMNHLADWLKRHGYPLQDTLVIGDRAMLSDEIALAYDQQQLRYLVGLRCLKTVHKELVSHFSEAELLACPLEAGLSPHYWGRGCSVPFSHNGQTVTHKGLVILAGPLRDQLRQTRQADLQALAQQLAQVKAEIGQPRLRTLKAVQRRANARCQASKVGQLMSATAYQTQSGQLDLRWQIDTYALWQAEQKDGRYLLVTNDWSLSHAQIFQLYRDKDGVEKRFHICKSDLHVSPLYLHQDQRIASMLLLNMLALLAYSLLERQLRQQGLPLTTRQLIKRLQLLTLIETHCHDGSCLRRLTPVDPAVALILSLVAIALDDLLQATPLSRQLLLPQPTSAAPLAHLPSLC